MTSSKAKAELHKYASEQKAQILRSFFKTGPGEYGEGDVFIGIKVPEIRKVAKIFSDIPLTCVQELMSSPIHEERLLALLILVLQFEKGAASVREQIVTLYLNNTLRINNWDLVDLSAPKILGVWLLERKNIACPDPTKASRSPRQLTSPALPLLQSDTQTLLTRLAKSTHLWERRIAIVATYAFIREQQFQHTLHIADMLLTDKHDLIHKATGWMLREVGKRDLEVMVSYLRPRYKTMPRTMLRYAIERLSPIRRKAYLTNKI